MNLCPDEYMRFDIPKWIFNNNKLPIGDEKELINPLWGYSYGFSPYFASIVSVFFMRLVSLFTDEATNLFLAARFISVLSGTGTVLLSLLIGRELFKLTVTRFTFAVIVGFLPQFVFLSSFEQRCLFCFLFGSNIACLDKRCEELLEFTELHFAWNRDKS